MLTVKHEFMRIILNEAALTTNIWDVPSVDEVYSSALYLGEIAESSLVLRSYANRYGLTEDMVAFESVGAHTNLVMALVDRILEFKYGPDIVLPDDSYSYREIMEAVRLHDLPENVIGDIPDNGSGNAKEKAQEEKLYYDGFFDYYPERETTFKHRVLKLLEEMNGQLTPIGKILYCADKAAANFITLQYDLFKMPPRLCMDDENISIRDREEMELCDDQVDESCRASEMWTIDWFKARRLVDFDTTGFFTALIVMRTLQVRKHWYAWREKDYS